MSWYEDETVTVLHGDCIEVMRSLPDDSVDSIVTDPPYGLGFMGRAWDSLPPGLPWAQECLRVLKPGGHLLAFGGTRTWHRLAVAVEDAGFEVRDSIAWLYGSGFPKSLDVSKAIDKAAGAQREVIGTKAGQPGYSLAALESPGSSLRRGASSLDDPEAECAVTAPATPAAQQWAGWGTALKPAFEPVVVARKPLAGGTVAGNVLAFGTGALNIDATRVGAGSPVGGGGGWAAHKVDTTDGWDRPYAKGAAKTEGHTAGRWPANVVLDGSQADALDTQSGTTKSTSGGSRGTHKSGSMAGGVMHEQPRNGHDDSGGASRFFPTFRYQAKAPTAERPKVDGIAHPTVKPLELMRWLVRLVTPPSGTVLEPFAGSGTTVEAAMLEGFRIVAIEREPDYLPLILARINRVGVTPPPPEPEPDLLDLIEGDVA